MGGGTARAGPKPRHGLPAPPPPEARAALVRGASLPAPPGCGRALLCSLSLEPPAGWSQLCARRCEEADHGPGLRKGGKAVSPSRGRGTLTATEPRGEGERQTCWKNEDVLYLNGLKGVFACLLNKGPRFHFALDVTNDAAGLLRGQRGEGCCAHGASQGAFSLPPRGGAASAEGALTGPSPRWFGAGDGPGPWRSVRPAS